MLYPTYESPPMSSGDGFIFFNAVMTTGGKAMHRFISSITITLLLLALATGAGATILQTINYQGYLSATDGTPVNSAVNVTFALYAAASGGNALWTESQSVTPANGVYSVQLGRIKPLAGLFVNDTLFLGVQVGTDAEMTPRQQLTTAPYAFRAGTADSVTVAQISGILPVINGGTGSATQNFVDLSKPQTIGGTKTFSNTIAGSITGNAATATTAATFTGSLGGDVTGNQGTTVVSKIRGTPVSTTAPAMDQVMRFNGTNWAPATGNWAASGANSDITSLTGLNSRNAVQLGPYGTNAGNTGEARFLELTANGANYVALKAPDALTANVTLTLPATAGIAGQTLSTSGSGALSWTTPVNGTVTGVTASAPLSVTNGNTTPAISLGTVGIANGGTGAITFTAARTNLGAAAAGANGDITSLSGLTTALSIGQGGTGGTSVSSARTGLGVPGLSTANNFTTGAQTVHTGAPATTGLVVQGAAGQTARLQEWQNNSGTPVTWVGPLGVLGGNGAGLTNVNAATLGGFASSAFAQLNAVQTGYAWFQTSSSESIALQGESGGANGYGVIGVASDPTGIGGAFVNSATTGKAISAQVNGKEIMNVADSGVNVNNSVRVDAGGANNGIFDRLDNATTTATSYGLIFGAGNSGEGIASKRTSGGNNDGLDFYTLFTNRMSITHEGDVRIPGMVRFGSESGTADSPKSPDDTNNGYGLDSYNGLVVRRAVSTNSTKGSIIARTDKVRLERDGTDGGIQYTPTGFSNYKTYPFIITCTGMTVTGAALNKYIETQVGTGSVYANSDNVVQFDCRIGDTYAPQHDTRVSMHRGFVNGYWVGEIISSYNQ
jgi:hypothetical protein